MKVRSPKGTYDVLPDAAARRLELEEAARRILGGAGYRRIETPIFEDLALFKRGVGDSTDIVQKEMFAFTDQGGRDLALRPEGTASVCRAYVEHGMHKLPQPVKLWYLGPFFRQEAPQAGRYRQFWQLGAEALGSDDPAVDAEAIALLQAVFDELEVRGLRLRLGTLGSQATRAAYREELAAYLRANEAGLSDDVRARIDLNPLRAFDSSHPGTQQVMAGAPRLIDALDADDRAYFAAVQELLVASEVDFEVDPTLVRGLDYYTQTVFEFTSDALGAQSGVGGGGRYDGLVEQLGGPPTPGIGWAAGVERILMAAAERPQREAVCDLYVALVTPEARAGAFRLAAEARRAGLAVQVELAGRSMKGQLKQASRLRAHYVAVIGGERAIEVKDMETGEQEPVESSSAAVARVLKGRFVG